jgi:lysyl-tRNA synthetase class 2
MTESFLEEKKNFLQKNDDQNNNSSSKIHSSSFSQHVISETKTFENMPLKKRVPLSHFQTPDFFQAVDKNATEIEAQGHNLYPSYFIRNHPIDWFKKNYEDMNPGEERSEQFTTAGRLYAIRNEGLFLDIRDSTNKIQLFCEKRALDKTSLNLLPLLGLGDIIGAEGHMKRTKRGEISLAVSRLTLLSKCWAPMPDKRKGIGDTETRYRHRHLDWIGNERSRLILRARSYILKEIRHFLEQQDFFEVDTPILQEIAGGAEARPFSTFHNSLNRPLFLRIAPELYLKRILIGGAFEKIFELGKNFRNEGLSPRHNPEFTTIEIYEAYKDYTSMMDLTEGIWNHILQTLSKELTVLNPALNILSKSFPWHRRTMHHLIEEYTGIQVLNHDVASLVREANIFFEKTFPVECKNFDATQVRWGDICLALFEAAVEPHLQGPIHVTHYPKDISPLAKETCQDARLTERFETYINTWEVANGFSELNDPYEQKNRFDDQEKQRSIHCENEDHFQMKDIEFIQALLYALPPTAGLGIGIDRLIMLMVGESNIRDVIPFSMMKSKDSKIQSEIISSEDEQEQITDFESLLSTDDFIP